MTRMPWWSRSFAPYFGIVAVPPVVKIPAAEFTPTTPEMDAPTAALSHRAALEEADAVVQSCGDAARILNIADAGDNHDSVFATGHRARVVDAAARCAKGRCHQPVRRVYDAGVLVLEMAVIPPLDGPVIFSSQKPSQAGDPLPPVAVIVPCASISHRAVIAEVDPHLPRISNRNC